jgi:hypothetical protein
VAEACGNRFHLPKATGANNVAIFSARFPQPQAIMVPDPLKQTRRRATAKVTAIVGSCRQSGIVAPNHSVSRTTKGEARHHHGEHGREREHRRKPDGSR